MANTWNILTIGKSMEQYQIYTLQPGDSLFGMAQKFTGNPWRYMELVEANPQLPRGHFQYQGNTYPTLQDLRVGQNIRIPNYWVDVSGPMIATAGRKKLVGTGNVGVGDVETAAAAGLTVLTVAMMVISTVGTIGGVWYLVDKIKGRA